jgi:hypothetical protein
MSLRLVPRIIVLAFSVVMIGNPAHAQAPRYLLNLGVGSIRLESTTSSVGDQLSGIVFGGGGRVSFGKLEADVHYDEGHLDAQSGTPVPRDLVEGHLMVGVRPVSWLSIKTGPHARGYVAGGITERWLLWEARVTADAYIIYPVVRGFLEAGGTLHGSIVNGAGPFGNSRLGEAGMVFKVPRAPLWFRVSYGVERTRFASTNGLDAMETLNFAVGIGR